MGSNKRRVCEPWLLWADDGFALAAWQRCRGGSRARVSIPWVLRVVLCISGVPWVSWVTRVARVSWITLEVTRITRVARTFHPLRLQRLTIWVGTSVHGWIWPHRLLSRRDRDIVVSLPHVSWRRTIVDRRRVGITASIHGVLRVGGGHWRGTAIGNLILRWVTRSGIWESSSIRTVSLLRRVSVAVCLVSPVLGWARRRINLHPVIHTIQGHPVRGHAVDWYPVCGHPIHWHPAVYGHSVHWHAVPATSHGRSIGRLHGGRVSIAASGHSGRLRVMIRVRTNVFWHHVRCCVPCLMRHTGTLTTSSHGAFPLLLSPSCGVGTQVCNHRLLCY